jgi:hypothetical protein
MKRRRRQIAAFLMLPILLLAGMAQAGVLFRCRMDGEARKTCCCPKRAAEQPEMPTLSRGYCCDTEATARAEQPPAVQSAEERAAIAAIATPFDAPIVLVVPPEPLRRPPAVAQAPPPIQQPILLQKSSRLI